MKKNITSIYYRRSTKNLLFTCITFAFLFLLPFFGTSQGISVSVSGAPPHNTAALDVQSNSQGFLVPRITEPQRDAINSPAIALQIYNTTTNCLQIYMPTSGWKNIRCDLDEDSISGGCPTTLSDVDGNTYSTIKIGEQCWTKENLKTTKYADDSDIPNITDNAEWSALSSGGWSYNNNDEANNDIYGKMYNWYAATDSRGLCPTGWHVPSDDEWKTLELELGMSPSEINLVSPAARGASGNVGGKMKSTSNWLAPNTSATNESGFSGNPGGIRVGSGIFSNFEEVGLWWSTSDNTPSSTGSSGWVRMLSSNDNLSTRTFPGKNNGVSVRCIKD